MKVCFLLTHIPDPRMNKRIEVFKKCSEVNVICVKRNSQDIWKPAQDVKHFIIEIDLPSAKHLVKRYIKSNEFQKQALEKLSVLKPDIIYSEGLDTLLIAGKYKKKNAVKIIYEVADLRESYIIKPSNPLKRIITEVILKEEKKAFKNVDSLIVTSPKFYTYHYKKLIDRQNTLYIPNIPDIEIFKKYRKKTEGEFTIGFIGGIRYLKQMKMLVDAAKDAGCRVLFAGAGGTANDYIEIKEYCEGQDHVVFTGRYDYNKQIADLYGSVDCVYAVYDADNPNVRIALPNKLYESVICELPIIVAKETYLEELVNKWGVGVSVSHTNTQELTSVLKRLSTDNEYYNNIVHSCIKEKRDLELKAKSISRLADFCKK